MTNAAAEKILSERFLSDKELSDRYGISRMSVWRWTKQGKLPKPIKFSGVTRWRLSEVVAHMEGYGDGE